ncbi:hypothetical protein BC830DRAFT_1082850 [Chytriomyces sp. MP71]|nr:hypothetical protein BC830DRAFT_1082850 [Chytriomyces sp. MP71]
MFGKLFHRKKHDHGHEHAGQGRALPVTPAVTSVKTVSKATTSTAASSGQVAPHVAASALNKTSDAHVHAVARGLRVPLTMWVVGYSTLSMLPKALDNDALLRRYAPGVAVIALGRGELAYEPLFLLSGLAAGVELSESIPEGEHLPDRWSIAKFWATKAASVAAPIASVLFSVAVSRFTSGANPENHSSRVAHLFGALTDCAFYLSAPWVFKSLRTSDRGAAPRLSIGSSILAGIISLVASTRFGLHPPVVASVPFAYAVTPALASSPGLLTSIPLRFPAFFSGLALAAERQRSTKGSGPSKNNQIIGAIASALIWAGLLFTPPSFNDEGTAQIFAAFRYPTLEHSVCVRESQAAALASYLALRPIIAVPLEESLSSPWRVRLHEVLTHPYVEAVATIALTAEIVHKEVITGVFYIARRVGVLEGAVSASDVSDLKVIGIWGVVVVLTELDLKDCHVLSAAHVAALADALSKNTVLKSLNLTNTKLNTQTATGLAKVLETNSTLEVLNLERNAIGPAGIKAIAMGLGENRGLRELKLSGQALSAGTDAEQQLAKNVTKNLQITKITLSIRDISSRNAVDRAIARNQEAVRKQRQQA